MRTKKGWQGLPALHPFRWSAPDYGTSNFITSVLPSPLKSPARTCMFEGVHQVAHRLPLNVLEPFDSPTHRPPLQLVDWSNFITSVLPSLLKSPVSTLIVVGVHHVAHR